MKEKEAPRKFQFPAPRPAISMRDFQEAGAAYSKFVMTIPPETAKHIYEPTFYAHVARARGLKMNDQIEVFANDGSFYGRLLVVYADQHQAKVVKLEWHEIEAVTEEDIGDADFEVKHIPNREIRWCVIRKSDGHRIQAGFNSREEAQGWIAKNQRFHVRDQVA